MTMPGFKRTAFGVARMSRISRFTNVGVNRSARHTPWAWMPSGISKKVTSISTTPVSSALSPLQDFPVSVVPATD